MITLKGCPFCGNAPEMQKWHGGGPEKRLISCSNEECSVNPGVCGETVSEAAKLWNMRHNNIQSFVIKDSE